MQVGKLHCVGAGAGSGVSDMQVAYLAPVRQGGQGGWGVRSRGLRYRYVLQPGVQVAVEQRWDG